MRIAGWALAVIASAGTLSAVASERLLDPARIASVWWVVPFLASLMSAAVLAGSAAAGGDTDHTVVSGLAYLVPGPSLAVLNLIPMLELGASPPAWVGGIMLSTLLASSWIFYRASMEPEAKKKRIPRFEAVC